MTQPLDTDTVRDQVPRTSPQPSLPRWTAARWLWLRSARRALAATAAVAETPPQRHQPRIGAGLYAQRTGRLCLTWRYWPALVAEIRPLWPRPREGEDRTGLGLGRRIDVLLSARGWGLPARSMGWT